MSNDWYKDAIIYELHVRSFMDSNNDGMGDFRGLIGRLDYLVDLGVTAVWLLPFYPSPWRDDGYDISDYRGIHPSYGTLSDFKRFLRAAHDRGLKVITELVINHTSNEHEWFQRARRSKAGTKFRDFYVWSDSPDRYADARIIFSDFERSNWTWDHEAGAYYWHRFYSHQPDLNFENPAVQQELFKVLDFWLAMGVDGLRLDAVPYLYEAENTNCENLPATHAFLKKLRRHVDDRFEGRMILAEANQWPEDAVAYFGDGDECHMAFHFPLMPRLFMGLQMEDRHPVVDILEQTPQIPEGAQWAIFLRNHDELTLEMVTDEERDYMYRVYAEDPRQRINQGIRRRLSPLLGGDPRKIQLMNFLLFSLPGSPIIYYGDELGMGDNVYLGDRDGVRTPMQWSSDKNAGFSGANPQRLYLPVIIDPQYHYETVNVETQQANPAGFLWWMKRIVATRKNFRAFSRGDMRVVAGGNMHVLAFVRSVEDETVLVVVNFSRYVQVVDLDLSEYAGLAPVEVFSRNEFPHIGKDTYILNIGGHECYWFSLERTAETLAAEEGAGEEIAVTTAEWRRMGEPLRKRLEPVLMRYTKGTRWFRSKNKRIRGASIVDQFPMAGDGEGAWLLILKLWFTDESEERYLLPLAMAGPGHAELLASDVPQAVVARSRNDGESGVLYEATHNPAFRTALLRLMSRRRRQKGRAGNIMGHLATRARRGVEDLGEHPASRVLSLEQSNTSILYKDEFFFKLYRKAEEGPNPEVEILRYLSDGPRYEYVPAYAGDLEYLDENGTANAAGLLVGYVAGEGDAWDYTLSAVDRYFNAVLALPADQSPPSGRTAEIDGLPMEGYYLDLVELLGRRTGELHLALGGPTEDARFKPEAFSLLYQRSLFQSMKTLLGRVKRSVGKGSEAASFIAEYEGKVLEVFSRLTDHKLSAKKTRIHGDFHLGQVLFTGRDFVIIDFEGEPARPVGERRLKFSPLRDVAGMVRSFHYAVSARLSEQREEDRSRLSPWAEPWFAVVADRYLSGYHEVMAGSSLIPEDPADRRTLLDALILEKAVYEMGYEAANRPTWLPVPMEGIRFILREV